MKILVGLLFIIIITGCNWKPADPINAAAVNVSGVFIRTKGPSGPALRISESKVTEIGTDSTYHVSGLVEGFSSMNYPVSVEHFSETVHYLGGDPNNRNNWECIEIYVGDKKRF